MDDLVDGFQFLFDLEALVQAKSLQCGIGIGVYSLAIPMHHGFGGGECEDLPAIADSFYAETFVDHGFGDAGISPCGFSRGSHHGSHVRLVFVGLYFALGIDYGGGADGRSRIHVYAVAGNGNQGSGGSGIDIDIDHGGNRAFQKHGPDFVRFFERSAKGVQFQLASFRAFFVSRAAAGPISSSMVKR